MPGLVIVPVAVAYDLVLEDHILARQGVKRAQRAFSRELAEMVRYAVGYRSRAFVTFGRPVPLDGYDAESRRSVLDLAHLVRRRDRAPLQGVADGPAGRRRCAPRSPVRELRDRIAAILDTLRATGANLACTAADEAIDAATEPLETRGIIAVEDGVYRVRERHVLRYYGRSLQHLLTHAGATH